MLGPIPRHAALINANATPSMGTIFTLAIRQSFGLSLPQASTPQIHPDSIIPFPVSAAIWDFIWECGGQRRIVVKDFNWWKYKSCFFMLESRTIREDTRKKDSRNKIVPAGLMSLLNKNDRWGCCRHHPGEYFMRTLGLNLLFCLVFFFFFPASKCSKLCLKTQKRTKNMWRYSSTCGLVGCWSRICGPGVSPEGPQ